MPERVAAQERGGGGVVVWWCVGVLAVLIRRVVWQSAGTKRDGASGQ